MIRNWFKRGGSKENSLDPGHTEISEKKTTKAGYFLLIVMFFFIVSIGQTVFEDLGRILDKPKYLSDCSGQFKEIFTVSDEKNNNFYQSENYYNSFDNQNLESQSCVFTEYENKAGVSAIITASYSDLSTYFSLKNKIQGIDDRLSFLKDGLNTNRENYNISLQERQALVPGVVDGQNAGQIFSNLEQERMSLEKQKMVLSSDLSRVEAKIKQNSVGFFLKYEEAYNARERAYNFYELKTFLLIMIFVLPLFLVSLRKYFIWKKADSPYTIISSATVAAFAVLLIQAVLMFLYEIIPHRILELLLKFFEQFAFLRYVLYYGSVLLTIVFFGGIVYYIQKNVFNRRSVILRAFKNKKCPNCNFLIDISMQYCPSCANHLQSECSVCHGLRFLDLPVCHNCGDRKNGE